jgi:cobalamin biosynthesis Mg chelatase CobN
MDLREIGWEIVDWMHLAQDRDQWQAVVKTVMNLRDQVKEDEMGGACSMHGRDEKFIRNFNRKI